MKTCGFTFMEVLIAMILLAVVGAMSFSSLSSTAKVTQTSGSNVALNVGRGVLETLYEAVRNDWWPNANRPLSIANPGAQFGNITLNGVTYARPYTTASIDVNGDATEDYRRATVTVCWNQGPCP